MSGNAPSPAKELNASLTAGALPVILAWQAPHLDEAVGYSIYRFEYDPAAVFPPAVLPTGPPIATVWGGDGGAPSTMYLDSAATSGQYLAYFVIAHFADGVRAASRTSPPSPRRPARCGSRL